MKHQTTQTGYLPGFGLQPPRGRLQHARDLLEQQRALETTKVSSPTSSHDVPWDEPKARRGRPVWRPPAPLKGTVAGLEGLKERRVWCQSYWAATCDYLAALCDAAGGVPQGAPPVTEDARIFDLVDQGIRSSHPEVVRQVADQWRKTWEGVFQEEEVRR